MTQQVSQEQRIAFQKAVLALHKDIPRIGKDSTNPHFRNKYVSLPVMLSVIKPIANKHGFILSQPIDVGSNRDGMMGNVVMSVLTHAETGLNDIAKLALSDSLLQKKDMQGLGGAITYGRRYTLSALLGLEEADDDGNLASGRTSTKKSKIAKSDDF